MAIVSQLIVNGLIAGSIYALVASGFSLIYGTNRFMHFTHGISVVIAGYLLLTSFSFIHLPFYIACVLTILCSGLFGLLMNRIIYVPLQNKNSSTVVLLIASVAIMILFENIIRLIFGSETQTIGYITVNQGRELFGAIITPLQYLLIVSSLILLYLLYVFMKKTKLGRDMRAVADNKQLASIIGINHKRISDYSFIIGSGLAGVAGILISLEQNLNPTMGTSLMIKGFTGAVIGGMSSVPAAVVGSLFLGFAENIGIWFLPSGYKDAIAFVLLFLFLLLKPTGVFGIKQGVKQ